MYLPPDQRRPGYPPQPDDRMSKRSEAVLLWLVGAFLLSMLLGTVGGSTLAEAALAVVHR